ERAGARSPGPPGWARCSPRPDSAGPAERGDDRIDVVDAAAPGTAAHVLEGGPEPGVGRQVGIGCQIRARRPRRQDARPLLGAEPQLAVAHEVDAPFEAVPIDDDLDQVPVQDPPDRPSRERLRPDVADARTGRYAV